LRIRSVLFLLALSNLHWESSWLLLIWGVGMEKELFKMPQHSLTAILQLFCHWTFLWLL
jgi:hypothetical protein